MPEHERLKTSTGGANPQPRPNSDEADENTCRESFKPSEAAKMARLIEEAERPKAAARMAAGKSEAPSEKFAEGSLGDEKGRTKTIAARAVGMSRPTLEKAQAVVEAGVASQARGTDRFPKIWGT